MNSARTGNKQYVAGNAACRQRPIHLDGMTGIQHHFVPPSAGSSHKQFQLRPFPRLQKRSDVEFTPRPVDFPGIFSIDPEFRIRGNPFQPQKNPTIFPCFR